MDRPYVGTVSAVTPRVDRSGTVFALYNPAERKNSRFSAITQSAVNTVRTDTPRKRGVFPVDRVDIIIACSLPLAKNAVHSPTSNIAEIFPLMRE